MWRVVRGEGWRGRSRAVWRGGRSWGLPPNYTHAGFIEFLKRQVSRGNGSHRALVGLFAAEMCNYAVLRFCSAFPLGLQFSRVPFSALVRPLG